MNKDVALPVPVEHLAGYYEDVRSFQTQRAASARRNGKIIAGVAAVLIFANLGLVWTVASLVPLTKLVPVYLWVRPDGTVDSSVAMSRLPPTENEAVIGAALWEYVRLREGYSYDTAQYGYDVVSRMSTSLVRTQYQDWFNYPNPVSPQVVVGQKGQVEIEHISTAKLTASVMQVRYRRVQAINGQRPVATTWTATLQFEKVSNLPAAARLNNPGGVIVTSYQSAEDSAQ